MIWYLIRTVKELFSNKKFIISSFVILTLVVIGTIYMNSADSSIDRESSGGQQVAAFGVVDHDQSIYSKMIVEYFKGTESFSKFASIFEGEEAEVRAQFEEGKLSAYLIVPEGFADALMYGEDTKIKTVINAGNTVVSVMLSNMLTSYDAYITNVQKNSFSLYELMQKAGLSGKDLDKANFDTSVDLITKALQRDELFEKHEITTIPHTPIYKYYVWALISLMILYSSVLSGVSFLRELTLGTYARLRIIGHSIAQVLAGILFSNVIVYGVLTTGLTKLLSNMLNMELPWEAYAFVWGCVFASNAFFCLVACICRDKKTYMIFCNFGLLIMGILGGVVFPISVMPYRFLAYAKCSPNYWIIYRMVKFSSYGQENVLMLLVGLFVLGLAFYLLTLGKLGLRMKIRIGGEYEKC